MIDHVLACLHGHADNLIEPASALAALELILDVHQRLTQAASQSMFKKSGRHVGSSVAVRRKVMASQPPSAPGTACSGDGPCAEPP